jgi:protein-disulfide isomerase
MKHMDHTNKSKRNLIWAIIGALAAVIVIAVLSIGANNIPQSTQVEEPAQEQTAQGAPVVAAVHSRSVGPDTAQVTITEHADFGCITCNSWHQQGIKEQIIDKYGDQVQFVWRDFPVITPDSPKAAEAGLCAHDQGQFWLYHDLLYENAPLLGSDDLKRYAADLGLNTEQFDQCLDSGQHQAAVEQDLRYALEQGYRGVPSFTVNDQVLIGPPSFEQLSAVIDQLLADES